jgi:hypothetical protein
MLSVKAGNNKLLKPETQLKMRHLQAVRPDGNPTTTAAAEPIVTVLLQDFSTQT